MQKRIIPFIMLIALLLGLTQAVAQPQPFPQYTVTITPEQAFIDPGEGVQLEAHLFDTRGQAIDADAIDWSSKPDSLGEITDDGFFQAGRSPGEVTVFAIFKRGNLRYYGEAKIAIGRPLPPRILITVLPDNAVVEPGGIQQYRIVATANDNSNFVIDNIRWSVQPRHLGKIDQNGLFHADQRDGQGHIIAYVDINRVVYRGVARVTVSEKPTASVSGTVTDEVTGLPIAGAHLLVQKIGPIRWARAVRSDSTGSYTANNLIPGLYFVRATAKDYLPEYYDNKEQLFEANILTASADDSLTGIDFALGRGGAISGFVKAEADSAPLPRSLVTAEHILSKRKKHTLSAADGSFEISGLHAGDYQVLAAAKGYRSEHFDDAQPGEQPTILSVTPPDVITEVNFYLSTASGISGTVVDAVSGDPLAKATVWVFEKASDSANRKHVKRVANARTDENGEYLVGVRPGSYFVFAEARGYFGEYFDNQKTIMDANEVEVVADAHTQNIDFSLDRLGSISGTVIDENTATPLADATVIAYLERDSRSLAPDIQGVPPSSKSFRTRTDDSGNYVLENLPAGNYYVQANAGEYVSEFYDNAIALSDADTVKVDTSAAVTGIDFALGLGGVIAGTVVDSTSDQPLAGVLVTVWSDADGTRSHAFTGQDGAYKITGLAAGEYVAFARLKGYEGRFYDGVVRQDEATPIKIESGTEAAGIDFQLPKFVTRAGTIAGVVRAEPDSNSSDPAGRPIPGAVVFAIPIHPGPAHFDMTDALGNYRITRLVPGEYIVVAWARGHIVEFYDDASHWRDATLVTAVANQVTEDIDFDLLKGRDGPYRIRGKVRIKRGGNTGIASSMQLDGLVVYAYDQAGIAASALTGANGEFSIDGIASGDYKLKINGAGYSDAYYGGADDQSAQTLTVSSGRSQQNIEIEIEETITGIAEGESVLPETFYVEQNYPNPFNPETTIRFALAAKSEVKLVVYNIIGQRVKTLVDRNLEAGVHQVQWNGTGDDGLRAASGLYLLRFEAGDAVQTRRMVLMK